MSWRAWVRHAVRLLCLAERKVQDRAVRAEIRSVIERLEDLAKGEEKSA